MKCKKCGGESRVVRTRHEEGAVIRERRCLACDRHWETREAEARRDWVECR